MPVTARSDEILRFRSICFGRLGAAATLNRRRQSATIVFLATILPIKWQTVPLEQITGAQVRKRESRNGQVFYGLSLRRRFGDDVNFACKGRDDAMAMMRQISDFLYANAWR